MQRLWSADELGERWTLLPEDLALLTDLPDTGKLGLAAQLAYWRQHGRFPDDEADLAPAVVGHLAAQVGVGVDALDGYDWAGRTGRRHRRTILDHLAIVGFDDAAEAAFRRWLADELLPREPGPAALEEEIAGWFARGRVTRPGAYRLDRILRSARAAHDDAALQRVADRLDAGTRGRFDALLADDGEGTAFARLVADPGRVGLESLLAEIGKLELLRALALPPDLLRGLHPDQVKRFRRRAAVESAWELRRHPERIRLPLLAFYCVAARGRGGRRLGRAADPGHAPHHGQGRAPRRRGAGRGGAGGPGQGRHPVQGGRGRGRPAGRRGARGDLPRRRRAHLRGAGPRGSGARHAAEPARPHRGARLVRLLLPPHDAPAAGGAGLPLQQRHAPPAARRPRRDPARGRRGAAVLPGRGDRHRGRDPPEVARHRGRGRARRRAAGEPDQLRDLRAADAARAAALQGGVGGGRRSLPQPRRGPAGRLRRAPGRLLRARSACPRRRGRSRTRFGPRWPRRCAARPRDAAQRRGAPRPAPAASDRGQPARAAARAAWARRAQGRARPALADDGSARHAQGGRPAHRLHRRLHDRGDARGDRPRRGAAPAAALPLRPGHQRRAEAPRGRAARLQLQGAAAHAAALHRRRRPARRDPARWSTRRWPRATPGSGARARRPAPRTASISAPSTRT